MLSLDDETCIECGICHDLLPQFFEVREGSVRVRAGADPDLDLQAEASGAVQDCPSGSIGPEVLPLPDPL